MGFRVGEQFVELYDGPYDYKHSLYRNASTNMYYWKNKGHTIKALEGTFTNKQKAIKALETYLKSDKKPYVKKTRERFGGNPWEDSWRLPEPRRISEDGE